MYTQKTFFYLETFTINNLKENNVLIYNNFFLAEANGSGNGSAQNGEESAGDRKRKNEDEKDSVSKKAKLDEDEDGIVCLDDDIVEVEEDQSPAKKAELVAATVANPVTEEDSEQGGLDPREFALPIQNLNQM